MYTSVYLTRDKVTEVRLHEDKEGNTQIDIEFEGDKSAMIYVSPELRERLVEALTKEVRAK